MKTTDLTERAIYASICRNDGILARDIAKDIGNRSVGNGRCGARTGGVPPVDRHTVNQYLYRSPFMRELCYRDDDYLWHGMIRQMRPHIGLSDFCGWYGTVKEFLETPEDVWFEELLDGCRRIGRNLNDTRGLFHSFRDAREVMVQLFWDLDGICGEAPESPGAGDASSASGSASPASGSASPASGGASPASGGASPASGGADRQEIRKDARTLPGREEWEIAFELRINRAKYIRIYADVLVITEDRVFSLEFKMKDRIDPDEVSQAAKYSGYLEVLFGPDYDVIPALVLTRSEDLYTTAVLSGSTAEIPVCSGDMLFNLFDEYLGFLAP